MSTTPSAMESPAPPSGNRRKKRYAMGSASAPITTTASQKPSTPFIAG